MRAVATLLRSDRALSAVFALLLVFTLGTPVANGQYPEVVTIDSVHPSAIALFYQSCLGFIPQQDVSSEPGAQSPPSPKLEDYLSTELGVDESMVRIFNNFTTDGSTTPPAPPGYLRVAFYAAVCTDCLPLCLPGLYAAQNMYSAGTRLTTKYGSHFEFVSNVTVVGSTIRYSRWGTFYYDLEEHGRYTLNVTNLIRSVNGDGVFVSVDVRPGDSIYIPLLIAGGVLLGLAVLYTVARYLHEAMIADSADRHAGGESPSARLLSYAADDDAAVMGARGRGMSPRASFLGSNIHGSSGGFDKSSAAVSRRVRAGIVDGGAEHEQLAPELQEHGWSDSNGGDKARQDVGSIGLGIGAKVKERLRSLDTFRGIALSIMIFVNYGGGGYVFFDHSTWNGLTVADLVFPWFIWMMGVSMALSMSSFLGRGDDGRKPSCLAVLYKIFRRAAILFMLGLMVSNNNSTLGDLRIPGVLQRFAISFASVRRLHVYLTFVRSRQPIGVFRLSE